MTIDVYAFERAINEAVTGDDLTIHGTMHLGALIGKLRMCPDSNAIAIGFGHFRPAGLHSYRGYYDHLALGYRNNISPKVGEIRTELEAAAEGRIEFDGWKGGTYRMTPDSPIWLDNPGDASGTGILAVVADGDWVTLLCGPVD